MPRQILCQNEYCTLGQDGKRRKFTPGKPWGKYCCPACGDAKRMRKYYGRQKEEKKKRAKRG